MICNIFQNLVGHTTALQVGAKESEDYMMKWKIFFSILIISAISILGISIKNNLEPPEPIIVIEKSPIPHEYLGEFTLSFYTHTGNRTKTGVYPKANRTVAADPKKIPLNSYIYIEGWGVYHVEDVGGKIINNRLDIFLDKREDCIKNGIKKAKVYLLTTRK